MLKRFYIFTICLCCALTPLSVLGATENLTLLAFGDSITQGLARKYDGEGGKIVWGTQEPLLGGIDTAWGYPIELDKLLEANLQDDLKLPREISASIHNWGQKGWASTAALQCEERPKNCIDTVLESRPAEFILILFGSNDPYQGISSATTIFNLEQLIDRSREYGVEPIIGTITPNTDKHAPFRSADIEEGYNPLIRELAERKEVLLADHYLAMVEYWEALWTSGDGLHLSREGNQKMAETWYSAIARSNYFIRPNILAPLSILLHD